MNNWNTQQKNQHWGSTSDTLSSDSPSPGIRSHSIRHDCESNYVEPSFNVPQVADNKKTASPGQIQRRAKGLSADSILKGTGVSWVISPSTESPTSSEKSPPNTKSSNSQAVTAASSSYTDHWREVVDPESGRTYYYNRKTRASKWRLPNGAKLMKKASCQPAMPQYEQSTPIQNHPRDNNGLTEFRQRTATHSHRKECQPKVRQGLACPQENRPRDESQLKSQGINYNEKKQQSSSSQKNLSRDEFGAPADNRSDAGGETMPSHSMFPQDWTTDAVFCLYCGMKCKSIAIFGSQHLPQCNKFAHMRRHGLSTTHIELERVLFQAWSKIGLSSENCSPAQVMSHGQVAASIDPKYLPLEEEEDAIPHSRPQFYGVVESKTCPFCEKAFAHGSEFSAHLLRCTVRLRLRKQRSSISKEDRAPPLRRDCATPGRRMPWE